MLSLSNSFLSYMIASFIVISSIRIPKVARAEDNEETAMDANTRLVLTIPVEISFGNTNALNFTTYYEAMVRNALNEHYNVTDHNIESHALKIEWAFLNENSDSYLDLGISIETSNWNLYDSMNSQSNNDLRIKMESSLANEKINVIGIEKAFEICNWGTQTQWFKGSSVCGNICDNNYVYDNSTQSCETYSTYSSNKSKEDTKQSMFLIWGYLTVMGASIIGAIVYKTQWKQVFNDIYTFYDGFIKGNNKNNGLSNANDVENGNLNIKVQITTNANDKNNKMEMVKPKVKGNKRIKKNKKENSLSLSNESNDKRSDETRSEGNVTTDEICNKKRKKKLKVTKENAIMAFSNENSKIKKKKSKKNKKKSKKNNNITTHTMVMSIDSSPNAHKHKKNNNISMNMNPNMAITSSFSISKSTSRKQSRRQSQRGSRHSSPNGPRRNDKVNVVLPNESSNIAELHINTNELGNDQLGPMI